MASIIEKETGQAARARPDRRRAGQPLAHRHAPAGRPDDHLRPGRVLRRQPEEEPPARGRRRTTPTRAPACRRRRSPCPASRRCARRCSPAKTDALYYVSRGDGSSQFSRTLDEHNRAVHQVPAARRRMSARGKFITLEGVDGAGKSTHLQFIADAVAAGRPPRRSSRASPAAPTSPSSCARRSSRSRWTAVVETLLVFAARADHVCESDPAGARRGQLGGLRPLHRCDRLRTRERAGRAAS